MAEHVHILPQYPVLPFYQNHTSKNLCSTESVECRKKELASSRLRTRDHPKGGTCTHSVTKGEIFHVSR